jgi:molybdate transport system substrate-binding protein
VTHRVLLRVLLPALLPAVWLSASTSAGCATSPAAGSRILTVAAASSLTDAFTAIRDDFVRAHPGVEVRLSFGSSATFASQLEAGAPVDVFASADDVVARRLRDAGRLAPPVQVFARNQLTIVVKAGNPHGVLRLDDLASLSIVALCNSDAPCGRYAAAALQKAGVALDPARITRGDNARATLVAVAAGDADAAVVYRSDTAGRTDVQAVPLPAELQIVAEFPIAATTQAGDAELARAFVAAVMGDGGRARLLAAGFDPP